MYNNVVVASVTFQVTNFALDLEKLLLVLNYLKNSFSVNQLFIG